MKKLLLILFCIPMIGLGQQMTYVPDDNFEAYLEANGMGDGISNDNLVFTSAIDTVISLNLDSLFIADLTGIGDFSMLTSLTCKYNIFQSLNLNNHPSLTYLDCRSQGTNWFSQGSGNYPDYTLTNGLNVDGATALTYLDCSNNQLNNLDVSGATNLEVLKCAGNRIGFPSGYPLDVSNHPSLTYLDCSNQMNHINPPVIDQYVLTDLDVSGATALTYLNCGYNIITSLNLNSNTALDTVYCERNDLSSLLTSGATALTYLICNANDISSLNVSNSTALTYLQCNVNDISSLDVCNNLALTTLVCSSNPIGSLDVSNNPALTILSCGGSSLGSLDLRNGNNTNMALYATSNPGLTCIAVDDFMWAINNWTSNVDPASYFSNNCGSPGCGTSTGIQELVKEKLLNKIINVLGEPTKPKPNIPLFYIYDDGTVEKRIVVE